MGRSLLAPGPIDQWSDRSQPLTVRRQGSLLPIRFPASISEIASSDAKQTVRVLKRPDRAADTRLEVEAIEGYTVATGRPIPRARAQRCPNCLFGRQFRLPSARRPMLPFRYAMMTILTEGTTFSRGFRGHERQRSFFA